MKRSGFLFVLFALLALAGCAGLPETVRARRIEPGQAPALNPDEIVVVGRILFVENGKSKAPYGSGRPHWQLSSPKAKSGAGGDAGKRKVIPFLSTRADGAFAYAIPAGHYEMAHVEPFYYLPMIDPALEFGASEPGRTYYLGDLEVDIDATSWLGGLWGNYITRINHLEILDRFGEMAGRSSGSGVESDALRKALLTWIDGRIPELKSTTPASLLVAPAGMLRR